MNIILLCHKWSRTMCDDMTQNQQKEEKISDIYRKKSITRHQLKYWEVLSDSSLIGWNLSTSIKWIINNHHPGIQLLYMWDAKVLYVRIVQ